MASKTVIRRQGTAGLVEAAAAQHAAEVAERLHARAAALIGDEAAAFDWVALQTLLARMLEADREALEAADSAHIEELRDDIAPRERRDAAIEALHERVSRVRGIVEIVFGPGSSLKLFAVKGLTWRNPEVLRRQAGQVLSRLRDASRPLPEPRSTWMVSDPAAWAAEIESALAELVDALREVYADRRRAESTFRLKRRALDSHNRTYAAVTSVLSGFYRLAELDEYDERLRPAVPRQGTAAEREALEDELLREGGEVAAPEAAQPLRFPQGGHGGGEEEPAADERSVA
jgi:hypothetical protein